MLYRDIYAQVWRLKRQRGIYKSQEYGDSIYKETSMKNTKTGWQTRVKDLEVLSIYAQVLGRPPRQSGKQKHKNMEVLSTYSQV